ncbi:TonB-dependent receptor [Rhodanobacter sp. Si-c]|uniref:TonB-dependent receptor n=1 Tax=Rhodanobacter lycopersici TaxID=3162487 RepID=A0ABV3QDV3_9GAMM
MHDLLGITSNGFNYTAQYDAAALGSIIWAATFRKDGIYRGMRHGRVFDVSDLSNPDIKLAVMDDIEEIWVKEH